MSQTDVLELPPDVYARLLKAAEESGTTPVGWIEARLPGFSEADRYATPVLLDERVQELSAYLEGLVGSHEISSDTATYAWNAWKDLSGAAGGTLLVPDAAPGPNGELLYTWNRGEHHFELEMFANGSAEMFYANRESGELWGSEYCPGESLSPEAAAKLGFFA